jgi:hypothetical protein
MLGIALSVRKLALLELFARLLVLFWLICRAVQSATIGADHGYFFLLYPYEYIRSMGDFFTSKSIKDLKYNMCKLFSHKLFIFRLLRVYISIMPLLTKKWVKR